MAHDRGLDDVHNCTSHDVVLPCLIYGNFVVGKRQDGIGKFWNVMVEQAQVRFTKVHRGGGRFSFFIFYPCAAADSPKSFVTDEQS